MTAIQWLATPAARGRKRKGKIALIEMKYGDDSLDKKSGLVQHLIAMDAVISDPNQYQELTTTVESQFQQLDQLGLLCFNHPKGDFSFKVDRNHKPQIVFLLANHSPYKSRLFEILQDPILDEYSHSTKYDLRFIVNQFAGYRLFDQHMATLEDFRNILK